MFTHSLRDFHGFSWTFIGFSPFSRYFEAFLGGNSSPNTFRVLGLPASRYQGASSLTMLLLLHAEVRDDLELNTLHLKNAKVSCGLSPAPAVRSLKDVSGAGRSRDTDHKGSAKSCMTARSRLSSLHRAAQPWERSSSVTGAVFGKTGTAFEKK